MYLTDILKKRNMKQLKEKLQDKLSQIQAVNKESMRECKKIMDSRFIPLGSLGQLNNLCIQFAGITGKVFNSIEKPCHFIAAADNGITQEGISSSPVFFTKLVAETMLDGICTAGLFCKQVGAELNLVDIGIQEDLSSRFLNNPHFYQKKIADGTKNFLEQPAMTEEETLKAILIGIELIQSKKEMDCFSNGEMGIGNTCTSSALVYALSGKSLDETVGRGGGLSDDALIKKKKVIHDAFIKYSLKEKSALEILSCVGGFDIACMVGFYLGAAIERKPMLMDGFISAAAALIAYSLEPKTKDYIIATHCSEEPGMQIIMQMLDMKPFLYLNMRLGEGTGALLAYPTLKTALEVPKQLKTQNEIYSLYDVNEKN